MKTRPSLLAGLRDLYEGQSPEAQRFRRGLFAFDLVTVAFIVGTSFLQRGPFLETLDVAFGVVITLEVAARLVASRGRELLQWTTWTDLVAVASFLAPIAGEGGGFLRVLRTLRILRVYGMAAQLRAPHGFVSRNFDAIVAIANLVVFIFVMTAIVYETQHRSSEEINNYADALYFTVTALTTTGFGDITFEGTGGRMITVVIMIFGVTLFLRLAQVLFRPTKVRFPCPVCGLQRHDPDAVHCKACGVILAIPDEDD